MPNIAIVTDSTAYLTPEEVETYNITVIPLSINFRDESFEEDGGMDLNRFFEKVRQSKELPSSSQPAPGKFIEVYEKLAEDYDEIMSIHLSSKLSGTYQTALAISQEVKNAKVYPVDSKITTGVLGRLVIKASEMAANGKTVQEIIDKINLYVDNLDSYFVLDNLDNLIKGGRVPKTLGGVANALKIKPILTLDEGEIALLDKVRIKKKAMNKVIANVEKRVEESNDPLLLTVVYSTEREEALAFQKVLKEKFPSVHFSEPTALGVVIGTHVGKGMIGLGISIDITKY